MTKQAAVFEETYEKYLQDIAGINFQKKAIMFGAESTVDALIFPFFNQYFLISKDGVRGFDKKTRFALKVMLLKNILMCPASCYKLFHSTTETFLDMECLTITETYLTKQLLKMVDENG